MDFSKSAFGTSRDFARLRKAWVYARLPAYHAVGTFQTHEDLMHSPRTVSPVQQREGASDESVGLTRDISLKLACESVFRLPATSDQVHDIIASISVLPRAVRGKATQL